MNRSASSIWYGTGRQGKGKISTQSGILDEVDYALISRIDDQPGTNPEELIAAAHAGCFNMALAVVLGDAGFKPVRLKTAARVNIAIGSDSIRIKRITLSLEAIVPDIEREEFFQLASAASKNCTISAVIRPEVEIQLNVTLVN
jgi:osmotically inducible protein OsmC